MLYLQQNTTNKVCFESNTPTTYTGSTSFSLYLRCEMTNNIQSGITLTDLSSFPLSYHYFSIKLTGDSSVTGATYIANPGLYYFKVYGNTEVLNEGILLIYDNTTTFTNTKKDNDSYFSYEKE